MKELTARATIALPRALSGTEVMAAVKAVVKSHENDSYPPSHIEERNFDDGDVYAIGQTSDYPYQQLRVSGAQPKHKLIHPDEMYTVLVVKSHRWPRPEFVYAIGYGNDSVINAVCTFADELTAQFGEN